MMKIEDYLSKIHLSLDHPNFKEIRVLRKFGNWFYLIKKLLVTFKILTSDCKIREFEEKEIYMSYISLSFDCLWEIDHEVVATSCFSHKLNLVRFAKNF